MDDKDKSAFEEMVQTATSGIGEAAKSPVVPTQNTAAIAPEAYRSGEGRLARCDGG
jgi:hypothetical protein